MRLGESCEPLKGTDYGHIFFDSYVFDGKNYKAIETPPYRISHEKDPKDYSTWYYKSSGIYDNILVDISVS